MFAVTLPAWLANRAQANGGRRCAWWRRRRHRGRLGLCSDGPGRSACRATWRRLQRAAKDPGREAGLSGGRVAVARASSRDFSWAIPDWQRLRCQDRAVPAKTICMVLLQLVIVAQFRHAFDQGPARACPRPSSTGLAASCLRADLPNQLRCDVETVAFAAPSEMGCASGRYDWLTYRSPLHIQNNVYGPFVACRWWVLQYCQVGRFERKHGTDMLAQPIRS